jgi:predicted site-specific integrase-resolvase
MKEDMSEQEKIEKIMEKPLLRLSEAAEVLQIDRKQVLKFAKHGLLNPVKTPGTYAFYKTREIKALI